MNFLRSVITGSALLVTSCSPSENDLSKQIKHKVTAITSSGTLNSNGFIIVQRNGYTLQMLANGSWGIWRMSESNPFNWGAVVSETIFDFNWDWTVDQMTSMRLERGVLLLKQEKLDNSPGAQKAALNFLEKMGGQTQEHSEKSENLPWVPTARWATWAEWRMVFSPFSNSGLVDVVDIEPGTRVRCPMTGKIFVVPEMSPTQKRDFSLKPYTEMSEWVEDPVDKQLRQLNTIQGPPSPQQQFQYRNLFDPSFSIEGQSRDPDKK